MTELTEAEKQKINRELAEWIGYKFGRTRDWVDRLKGEGKS